MQERRNSIANALELCLSCTSPWKYAGLWSVLCAESWPRADEQCALPDEHSISIFFRTIGKTHEHHGFSNHMHLVCFVQKLVQANNKEIIKAPHYWPYVRSAI